MKNKQKKWSILLNATYSFFIAFLVLLILWNIFLREQIKKSEEERGGLKKDIEKLDTLGKNNRNFIKDVLRQKAITLCFQELIKGNERKYNGKEIEDCIQLIMMTDEKYGHEGLDAPLILAWLEKESGGDPGAVSYAGAKGLTQLMDFNAEVVFTAMGYASYHHTIVFNPVINLAGGLYYFIDLMNFWKWKGIKNQSLLIFYSLHSYKWGSKRTEELFNSGKSAYRPSIKYVNCILNRQQYWKDKLETGMNNIHESAKETEK
jgi:hypothetical protein